MPFSSRSPRCSGSVSERRRPPTPTRISAFVRWLEASRRRRPSSSPSRTRSGRTRRHAGWRSMCSSSPTGAGGLVLTEEPIPGSEGAALRSHALANFGHRTSELALGPLTDAAAESARRPRRRRDRPATRTGLIREAEGNPLYLEELARAFLEGALEPRGRTWTMTIGRSSCCRRRSRTSSSRGSTGRRTSLAGSLRSRRRSAAPSRSRARARQRRGAPRTLTALFRAEIVREVRRYPELECTFTHGLLREAALSTLTSTRKRALYARSPPRSRRSTRTHSTSTSSGSPTTTRRREPPEGARVRRARPRRVRLALEPPVLGVPEGLRAWAKSADRDSSTAARRHLEERDHRHVPRHLRVRSVQDARPRAASRIRSAWSRSRVTSRWQ